MRNKTIFVLLTICLEVYVDELIVKHSHVGNVVDYASSLHARNKVALWEKNWHGKQINFVASQFHWER